MDRRQILKQASIAAATIAAVGSTNLVHAENGTGASGGAKFKLAYGPHPGMFSKTAGSDVIDQIKFCADQGFTGFEYNGLPEETPEIQTKIGDTLQKLGMQMGVFVAYGSFDHPTFTHPDDASTAEIMSKMKAAVEMQITFEPTPIRRGSPNPIGRLHSSK